MLMGGVYHKHYEHTQWMAVGGLSADLQSNNVVADINSKSSQWFSLNSVPHRLWVITITTSSATGLSAPTHIINHHAAI